MPTRDQPPKRRRPTMSVFLYEAGISYYPAPKCGSSSLKGLFLSVEPGITYPDHPGKGRRRHGGHTVYPTMSFKRSSRMDRPDHFRFAIIRDPVDRLLSAFSHRVLGRVVGAAESTPSRSLAFGAESDRFLARFIDELEAFRAQSRDITHHTNPLVYFLGDDSNYFSDLYLLSDLGRLELDLSDRLNLSVSIAPNNRSVARLSRDALTKSQITRIEKFYARDYEVFGRYLKR